MKIKPALLNCLWDYSVPETRMIGRWQMKSVGRRADFIKRVVFWGVSLACLSGRVGAAEASRPNILFVLADDWGIGHAGAYGCSWVKTPAFDSVARVGILFLNAYTPNAKCAPSRSCILTGRNPWQLKAACNHMAFLGPSKLRGKNLLPMKWAV